MNYYFRGDELEPLSLGSQWDVRTLSFLHDGKEVRLNTVPVVLKNIFWYLSPFLQVTMYGGGDGMLDGAGAR